MFFCSACSASRGQGHVEPRACSTALLRRMCKRSICSRRRTAENHVPAAASNDSCPTGTCCPLPLKSPPRTSGQETLPAQHLWPQAPNSPD
ncbi:hypothetical protein Y1Q_0013167 [Alligator mississippiensis]|uniref:Uncharacterized protein n=1 Tax=Alligator mississippiensis TaxID=8496 RepID=A0A151P4H1_ALLMI|nr:hypothetical protein Y1Q_0013167 [Alligator mississippiensis]